MQHLMVQDANKKKQLQIKEKYKKRDIQKLFKNREMDR